MTWIILFAVSIAQGIFLLSLIVLKGSKNSLAGILMWAMVLMMILTNLGYLTILTDLGKSVPQLFALPFGMMFLLGPLFYFYARAVLDVSFRWKNRYWLHLIPYAIQLFLNWPLLTADRDALQSLASAFLAHSLEIRNLDRAVFTVQIIHFGIYVYLTLRQLPPSRTSKTDARFMVPMVSRVLWVRALVLCFSLFLLTVAGSFLFVLFRDRYYPLTNYLYTLALSLIIYFVAYRLVLTPELISPDFSRKYQAYMPFGGETGEFYVSRIRMLMQEQKLFTNPDLKLAALATEVGLPPHQLSKLINEKFGKSFNDFINEYRVRAFIEKVNQKDGDSYTLYGMALDVGFNSKSSFNTAFKKITGKNPSEFRPHS